MFKKTTLLVMLTVFLILAAHAPVFAKDPAALAAESESYCKSTATETGVSPKTVIAKVTEGCKLIEKEGLAVLPRFQGNGSDFIFEGTYIWIHTLEDATMLMHPIKYKLNDAKVAALRDKKGKKLFIAMNDVVTADGSGWVEYFWPIPGSIEVAHKISYVKGCTTPDGQKIVLGCGLYKPDVKALAGLTLH